MADSRIAARQPLVILCQHDRGSCAACCGAFNFVDRSPEASDARFRRRTDAVRAAWPNVSALAEVRDTLLAEERPAVLFAGVKVCPFAGYVDEPAGAPTRVGCLLHPTRHPTGHDLRDLAVYPKEVCAGHFCAPHDWLRRRETLLAQACTGPRYGRVVTDAGLVKAMLKTLEERAGHTLSEANIAAISTSMDALWAFLLDAWPFRDPDPRRFGGFTFSGDDAVERTLPTCLAGLANVDASSAERTILDSLGTGPLDERSVADALSTLRQAIDAVVQQLATTR